MKSLLMVLFALLFVSCNGDDSMSPENGSGRNFKQDMREYVMGISRKAKLVNPKFAVIPQNGIELVTINGEDDGSPASEYLAAIDGNGQEDLFYGYENDDKATSSENSAYLQLFLSVSKNAGKTIFVTDYTSIASKVADSYQKSAAAGYISYAAPHRSLDVIPITAPNNVNSADIATLSQARNFLYLINPQEYGTKAAFIQAVTATNYDAVIMDLFLNDEQFTAAEVAQLRVKANGGRRIVICYMSIGEAEDYRYYWQDSWTKNRPNWIAAENPDWPGNFKVKYWDEEWQGLIYKNQDSYLQKILTAQFDGVYLDIIDAFEYFEN